MSRDPAHRPDHGWGQNNCPLGTSYSQRFYASLYAAQLAAGFSTTLAASLFKTDRLSSVARQRVGVGVGGPTLIRSHFIHEAFTGGSNRPKPFNFLSKLSQSVFAQVNHIRHFFGVSLARIFALVLADFIISKEGIQEVGKVSQEFGQVSQGGEHV